MLFQVWRKWFWVLTFMILLVEGRAATYYLDSQHGQDTNDGLSEATPWRSLERAAKVEFKPGDYLLLKRGSAFTGTLVLKGNGSSEKPIFIKAHGEGPAPFIDGTGHLSGVRVIDSQYMVIKGLEIIADGGTPADDVDASKRFGIYIASSRSGKNSNIILQDLFIHDIYPSEPSKMGGRNKTGYHGTAIAIHGNRNEATDILIERCRIERTGFKAIEIKDAKRVRILDNHMKDIGGPAIQPGKCEDIVVRGNIVDGSGSYVDSRMHGRGSGIWPWTCKRVLIERNTFMHARGKADSCGIHIDFNCSDVVVQYNLSIDNEGGFVEILGNCFNSAYRYNISINDGSRVKGQNGAHQEGKVLWTSGFVGRNNPKTGPTNSYIYNNTIYVGPGSRSCFSIGPTTEGLLIANNIFHIMGETVNVLGDQDLRKDKIVKAIPRSAVRNNVYINADILPAEIPYQDMNPFIGDPQFESPGGLRPEDYIPGNKSLVQDRGIVIPKLEGDEIGLRMGLEVEVDFLGNPIKGPPDIGAIEVSSTSD